MFSKKLLTLFTAISIVRANDVCSTPCGNAGSTGNPTSDLSTLLQNGSNCAGSPATNQPIQLVPSGTNIVPGYGACFPFPQSDASGNQGQQQLQAAPPLQQVGIPVQFAPVVQPGNEQQKSCSLTTTMNCAPTGEGSQAPGQPKDETTPQTPSPLPPVEVPQPQQPQQPGAGSPGQQPIMGVDPSLIQCPSQLATFGNQTGQANNGQDHVFGSCFSNATNKVNYPTVVVGNVEMPASPNLTISQNGCGSTQNICTRQ